jgi:hypothetical protein
MTKTKRTKSPAPSRCVVSDELLYLLGLATNAAELTQEEFLEKYFRPVVCRVLSGKGIDADAMLANRKAARS